MVGQVVYDYQALIAGILAIVAAFVAAHPVWKQLQSMRMVSYIELRDLLLSRISELEARRRMVAENLGGLPSQLLRDLFPGDPEAEPKIDPEWAFNAEKVVGRTIKQLTAQHDVRGDTAEIDGARQECITLAGQLLDCLTGIHSPYSMPISDPDYYLTKEQVAQIKAEGLESEGRLVERISDLGKASEALEQTFDVAIRDLRSRIRRIDDELTT